MDVLIERRIYANPMLNLYVTNRNNVEILPCKVFYGGKRAPSPRYNVVLSLLVPFVLHVKYVKG